MKVEYATYNFKKYNSCNNNFNIYSDSENVVALTIFSSGWKGKYHCVEEWGEYGETGHHLYTSEEIFKIYGIKSFSRKEKLTKIGASIV